MSGPVLEPSVLAAKEVDNSPNAGNMFDCTEKFRKSGPQLSFQPTAGISFVAV